MDIDHVIDVPDTPDRSDKKQRSVGEASRTSVVPDVGSSGLMISCMHNKLAGRNHIASECRLNGKLNNHHNRGSDNSAAVGIVRDFVSLGHKNNSHDFVVEGSEQALLFRKVPSKPFKPDRRHPPSSQRMDDRKSMHFRFSSKPSDCLERHICPHREQGVNHRFSHKLPPQCAEEDQKDHHTKSGSPLVIGSSSSSIRHPPKSLRHPNKGKEKIEDVMLRAGHVDRGSGNFSLSRGDGNLEQKDSVSVSVPTSSRITGRKRLVRNGCISPLNIAKVKPPDENSSKSSIDEILTGTDGKACVGPSHVIDLDEGINLGRSNQLKGKEVVSHPCSSRQPGANLQDLCERVSVSKRQKKLIPPTCQGNGRDVACIDTQGESSCSRSKTNGGFRDQCTVIKVEDSSPKVRQQCSENVSDLEARARQLEADEMLARELQEQLYHEMPDIGMVEVEGDSHLAWTVQQEERFARAPSNRNSHVNLRGGALPGRRQNRSPLARNMPRRSRTRARNPNTRLGRLRNQLQNHTPGLFPSSMDLDMRMALLEAMEAVVDDNITSVNQLLDSDREFDENDYEALLALDENNHEHLGASARHISNLPESTVRTEDYEACSICLDTPAIGDTIRHLPCLHKFHKDCIDPWLRRKRSCPVCKSDI